MSTDLHEQLRRYGAHFEAGQADIDLDVVRGTRPVPAPVRRPVWQRPVVVALASALLVLVAIGGIALLARGPVDVVDEGTTVPPITASSIPTTAPSTTIPDEGAATMVPAGPVVGGRYEWVETTPWLGQYDGHAEVNAVGFAGELLVAVGRIDDCALVAVREADRPWLRPPVSGPCGVVLRDVASFGPVAVAVGEKDGEPFVSRSWDGRESEGEVLAVGERWSPPTDTPFGPGDVIESVAASELGFVASGTGLWYSADGSEWLGPVAVPPSPDVGPLRLERVVAVAAGPDRFLAIGGIDFDASYGPTDATVAHSLDGTSWAMAADVFGYLASGNECLLGFTDVAYGPGGFVAVGLCLPGDSRVLNSAAFVSGDGVTWTQAHPAQPAFTGPAVITSVTATDDGYLAAGWAEVSGEVGLAVWSSPDGLTWERTALPALPIEEALLWTQGDGAGRFAGEFRVDVAADHGTAVLVSPALETGSGLLVMWTGTRP